MSPASRAATGLAVGLLAAACAATTATAPVPARAPDFRPEQVRQPLVLVRLTLGPGPWEERVAAALPSHYQGALLQALNARAVLPKEVQIRGERDRALGGRTALVRARELDADHAVLIEVHVSRTQEVFCRGGRRPFRATVTLWSQSVQVLRAHDGAVRLAVDPGPLDVLDLEADCEDPRESRQRSSSETIDAAVWRVLGRVVGP